MVGKVPWLEHCPTGRKLDITVAPARWTMDSDLSPSGAIGEGRFDLARKALLEARMTRAVSLHRRLRVQACERT
jgi:hypothetical protein